jgi:hypothetical protein
MEVLVLFMDCSARQIRPHTGSVVGSKGDFSARRDHQVGLPGSKNLIPTRPNLTNQPDPNQVFDQDGSIWALDG